MKPLRLPGGKLALSTILLIMSSMVSTLAQTPQYFWSNYSGAGQGHALNWRDFDSSKNQCIYRIDDFPSAPSGNLSSLYIRVGRSAFAPGVPSTYYNFSVRMGWSMDSNYVPISLPASPDTFAFKQGLSTVFSRTSFVITGTDTPGKWIKMPLIPNSFYFNKNRNSAEGKYIVVEFRLGGPKATNGFDVMISLSPGSTRFILGAISNPLSVSPMSPLIDLGFDIGPPVLGVDDADINSTLSIFPNPATYGRFSIDFSSRQPAKAVDITVRSMTGAVVSTKRYTNIGTQFSTEVGISNAAKGVYFVELLVDGERVIRKVTVD